MDKQRIYYSLITFFYLLIFSAYFSAQGIPKTLKLILKNAIFISFYILQTYFNKY